MKIHIVQKGDTMWKIAKKYGVDFQEMLHVNSHIQNPDKIMPGMKVKVPTSQIPLRQRTQDTPQATQPFVKEAPIAPSAPLNQTPKEMPIPPAPEAASPMMPPVEIDMNFNFEQNIVNQEIDLLRPTPPVAPKIERPAAPKVERPVMPPKMPPRAPAQRPMAPAQRPMMHMPPMMMPQQPQLCPPVPHVQMLPMHMHHPHMSSMMPMYPQDSCSTSEESNYGYPCPYMAHHHYMMHMHHPHMHHPYRDSQQCDESQSHAYLGPHQGPYDNAYAHPYMHSPMYPGHPMPSAPEGDVWPHWAQGHHESSSSS